jgi:Leucine-rich repeat (LRR) protein
MGLFGKIFSGIMKQDENSRPQEDIDFENQVRNDGYKHAGKRIADILNEKITSKDLARQFVLEELDAARQGNDFAQNFVKSSGFKSFEYVGAINRTKWEGDESELEHIQLFLRGFLIKISDINLMVQLSTTVVDKIMKIWGLGKYDNYDPEINETLQKLTELLQKEEVQEALTQSETFGTVGINQMTYIKQVNDLVHRLTKLTGKTPEEIFQDPTNLTRKKEEYISTKNEALLDTLIEWANKNNLPELKNEEHMIIAGGYFEGFPRDKKILIEIHTLNLPNCKIDTLPKEIGTLKKLKKLWLDGNDLRYLPDEICNLTLLEELYVPNNNIEKLPTNIGNLKNLIEINFKNNNIKYLPVSMILLKKLRKINFTGQKHGQRISTPVIASLILHGVFDNNTLFREQMSMQDESDWNELKNKFRNEYMSNIHIFTNGQKVPFLTIIEKIYGKEIADSQELSNFYDIAKL